jgi:hypothetical protein
MKLNKPMVLLKMVLIHLATKHNLDENLINYFSNATNSIGTEAFISTLPFVATT